MWNKNSTMNESSQQNEVTSLETKVAAVIA